MVVSLQSAASRDKKVERTIKGFEKGVPNSNSF